MTNNTQTIQLIDHRPVLARALDQTGRLITGTDQSRGGDPTPCADFDVAALVGHQLAVVRRIGAVVRGEPFDSVPQLIESTDWAADWESGRTATDTALADADLSRQVTLPWGEAPIAAALGTYLSELATHAWDLAAATGRVADLDPAIAEAALPVAKQAIPAQIRHLPTTPFDPVVEVADDASAYDRLAGWNGRDPRWTPNQQG